MNMLTRYNKFYLALILIFVSLITIFTFWFIDKSSSVTPKKIMFIVNTETSGGKGVHEIYKEMKIVGHDVKIVAIPYFRKGKYVLGIDLDFTKKFPEDDVIYPCGKEKPYTSCQSIVSYKPDYIFIQNPYNIYNNSILDPNFTDSALKKIARKIVYIPYGPHIFHQNTINDSNLPNFVDLVFVDSESTKDIYISKYNFPKNRVLISGYQTYKTVRDALKQNPHTKEIKTVLWLPRWVLTYKYKDDFEGGSTFLNYHYFFYNYALQNPDLNFIVRPHILLFSAERTSNFLTQQELDQIFEKLASLPNVTISNSINQSLVDDIMASDIIISDGTSALAEVVIADKPIIYLSNGWNNEFNSNQLSKELKKYIYLAYDPFDIIAHVETIKQNNYLPFNKKNIKGIKYFKCKLLEASCNREEFKEILDPVENPAKFIAKYLLEDKN